MLTQSLTQACGDSGGGIFPGYLNSGGHKASSERAGPGGRQLSLLQAWLRRTLFRISLVSYLSPNPAPPGDLQTPAESLGSLEGEIRN